MLHVIMNLEPPPSPNLSKASPSGAASTTWRSGGTNSSLIHISLSGVQLIQNFPFRSTSPRLWATNIGLGQGSSRWKKSQYEDSALMFACLYDSTVSTYSTDSPPPNSLNRLTGIWSTWPPRLTWGRPTASFGISLKSSPQFSYDPCRLVKISVALSQSLTNNSPFTGWEGIPLVTSS